MTEDNSVTSGVVCPEVSLLRPNQDGGGRSSSSDTAATASASSTSSWEASQSGCWEPSNESLNKEKEWGQQSDHKVTAAMFWQTLPPPCASETQGGGGSFVIGLFCRLTSIGKHQESWQQALAFLLENLLWLALIFYSSQHQWKRLSDDAQPQ